MKIDPYKHEERWFNWKGQMSDLFEYYGMWEKHKITYDGLVGLTLQIAWLM